MIKTFQERFKVFRFKMLRRLEITELTVSVDFMPELSMYAEKYNITSEFQECRILRKLSLI